MFGTTFRDHRKTPTNLHSFNGIDTHQRTGNLGIKLIKHRLAQTGDHSRSYDCYFCTNTVTVTPQLFYQRLHLSNFTDIGAEKRIVTHFIPVNCLDGDVTHLSQVTTDNNAVALLQIFFSDRTGRDSHRSLSGGRPPATTIVSKPVLLLVRKIRVSRSKFVFDLGVVPGALVLVLNNEPN